MLCHMLHTKKNKFPGKDLYLKKKKKYQKQMTAITSGYSVDVNLLMCTAVK